MLIKRDGFYTLIVLTTSSKQPRKKCIFFCFHTFYPASDQKYLHAWLRMDFTLSDGDREMINITPVELTGLWTEIMATIKLIDLKHCGSLLMCLIMVLTVFRLYGLLLSPAVGVWFCWVLPYAVSGAVNVLRVRLWWHLKTFIIIIDRKSVV